MFLSANVHSDVQPVLSNREHASWRVAHDATTFAKNLHNVSYIYSPYEVLAVAAEGRLFEEPWHKAVVLDHVDIFLLQGALPAPQLLGEGGVRVAGPEGVLARVRIVRHGAHCCCRCCWLINDDGPTRRRCRWGHTRAALRRERRPLRNLSRSSASKLSALSFRARGSAFNNVDGDRDRTRTKRPRAGAVTAHRPSTVCLARAMLDRREKRGRGVEGRKREQERWANGSISLSVDVGARGLFESSKRAPRRSARA